MPGKEPQIGELILGCRHSCGPACGLVDAVLEHVTADGFNHYVVTESWNGRTVRVKREPNGGLYEVEIVPVFD